MPTIIDYDWIIWNNHISFTYFSFKNTDNALLKKKKKN